MKSLISQVYELTNLAILTPQNLVENIQLDNYLEIKYYKREDEIVCEMLTEDDNEKIIYFYYFSKNNQLQRAFAMYGDENIELFDRNKELEVFPPAASCWRLYDFPRRGRYRIITSSIIRFYRNVT